MPQRAGGDADAELVARWLDDGIAPNGAHGRAFGERGVHGFDLTFCAPKSVSLVRALRTDDVVAKAIADAHTTALSEAMEYLAAHAGYTRVHNPLTGEKDLVRLPGLVAIAYQHETSSMRGPAPAHPRHRAQPPSPRRRATGVDRRHVAVSRSQGGRGRSIRPPCAANCTNRWGSSGRRSTRRPGWPSWPGWIATPSPRGRGAPPSCASGPPTTSTSSRAVVCRRRSWRPRRKPPARPNPKSWPGHSCWSSGAPMRAACAWTAQPSMRRARRGAQRRAPPFDRAAWPTRPRRSRRPRSPAPTWSRSSAHNYPSIPSAPRVSWSKPPSTRYRCG